MGLFDFFKTKSDKNENTVADTFVCAICGRTLEVSCRHHANVCATCANSSSSIKNKRPTQKISVKFVDYVNGCLIDSTGGRHYVWHLPEEGFAYVTINGTDMMVSFIISELQEKKNARKTKM